MKRTTLKTRLWALAATLLLLISLLALPVSAVAPTATDGKITFNKYLVMDKEANVPNVTFEFTIAAGQPATYGEDGTIKTAVYAGIMRENPPVIYTGDTKPNDATKYGKVTFAAGDKTTAITPVAPEAEVTQKKAMEELTVDFSGVTFLAPGIYRYVITETNGGASGITYDNSRTLDVYVQYEEEVPVEGGEPVLTDNLEVAYYVLHNDESNPNTAIKSDGFTNTYATYDLTLKKEVEGNQGDRDKYFMFTVNISNAVPGTVYSVVLPSEDNYTGNTQRSLTVDENGKVVDAIFYLKNDQSIVIQGLTKDTKYTIEEKSYSDDGYSTSYTVQVGDPPASTPSEALTTVEKTMGTGDNIVTFTNHKQGTVPTGILLETAPYLILGAVVVAGLVVLFATRRRRTRE